MPPSSSTIRSEPSRISAKLPRERVSTPVTSGRRPVIAATWSARSSTSSANAEPTVPWPSRPTLNVSGNQVLEGLPAHDDAGVAVLGEDDRRPRHPVVVAGHREAVGARGRRDDQIARARVVEQHLVDQHVAGLAVLADQPARRRAAEAGGDLRPVPRAGERAEQGGGRAALDGAARAPAA